MIIDVYKDYINDEQMLKDNLQKNDIFFFFSLLSNNYDELRQKEVNTINDQSQCLTLITKYNSYVLQRYILSPICSFFFSFYH
jgi:hypothetical protein